LILALSIGAAALLTACAGSQPAVLPASPLQTRAAGTFKILYSFQGGAGDGAIPAAEDAPLTVRHGLLFGTTGTGSGAGCGAGSGCGTVFQATTLGAESVLYKLRGEPDGANPSGPVTKLGLLLAGSYRTKAFSTARRRVSAVGRFSR
jgi:hypothetical protein